MTDVIKFMIKFRIPSFLLDVWTVVQEYQYISSGFEAEAHNFYLLPVRTYRSAIKICASETCFAPLYSDGITILSNPPQKGSISLSHLNTTETGGKEKVLLLYTRYIYMLYLAIKDIEYY